ncbi:MAG TPA: FtsX-like permease family protein, partial [Bacillota bacterium]|nr:FtsX-like permease family protein [Bacillota bacterium]
VFLIAFRKMMSNKWMLGCALLGAIVTVAMVSSIPIYTTGIMQRMLTRDLEISQQTSGEFPGGYMIQFDGFGAREYEGNNPDLTRLREKISSVIAPSIGLPILTQANYINAGSYQAERKDLTQTQGLIDITALSELQNHVKILYGRMFSPRKTDGVYEVMVTEEAFKVLDLTLDKTYRMCEPDYFGDSSGTLEFQVKVVGIFTYREENDPYWFYYINAYSQSMIMDWRLLQDTFIPETGVNVSSEKWFFAYDYHRLTLELMPRILKTYAVHQEWFEKYYSDLNLQSELAAVPILNQYRERERQLKITLVILQVPVLILLTFYTLMVSRLKIDFESNEIVVIKSRGGSGRLVFAIYLAESLIIGGMALVIGPIVGFYLCKILGASNGFLEFVNRAALPLALKPEVFLYAAVVVGFIALSMLIPAYGASRTSIVLYKQKKARERKTSFWERYFLDLALLAVSLYGLYGYQRQQKVLFLTGIKGTDLQIDPLLFVISTAFILGCGLLILRVFPYLVRLIFWLGEKRWSPVFYASFIQVGRTSGQEKYVMLFLILTLAVGVFSANAARTLNRNTEEKVRYEIGADIVVQGRWTNNSPPVGGLPGSLMGLAPQTQKNELVYFEPPYEPYTNLAGTLSVTKVLRNDAAKVYAGNEFLNQVTIMGLIPDQFGRTAWFKNGLLPHHWYDYLNLMTDSPMAVLASRSFQKNLGVKEGDWISIAWGPSSTNNIDGIIYAFIDYWPSINPNRTADGTARPYFVVANLNYIFAKRTVEPYQVWLKKKPGATSNLVYEDMNRKQIEIVSREDATEQIIKRKNDPLLQGTNGTLTLSFVVTMLISAVGFLIYWVMSIKKRALQFGIFRAMGLSLPKIIGMLVTEQFLITGSSIVIGVFVGSLAGNLFVPLLQLVYSAEQQVPPFRVVSLVGDYARLYLIVAFILLVAFIVLWRIITRINITQALKLGED